MPNYCFYEMKVVGKKEDREKFYKRLKAHYDYNENKFGEDRHLFRVFEANIINNDDEERYTIINGECAWSVYSCMLEGEHTYYNNLLESRKADFRGTSLLKESKDLNLDIEVFSEERDIGFMEHYLVRNGILEINEEFDISVEENEHGKIDDLEWDYTI